MPPWPRPDPVVQVPGVFSRFQRGAMPADLEPWIERWNDLAIDASPGCFPTMLRVARATPVLWYRMEALNADGTVRRGRLLLSGNFDHAVRIPLERALEHVAFYFRPGATRAIFGIPAAAVFNQRFLVADLFGSDGRAIEERLAQAATNEHRRELLAGWVRDRLRRFAQPKDRELIQCIRQLPTVCQLAQVREIHGWSDRQLQRLCASGVGMSLKRLSLVLRVGSVMQQASALADPDWVQVAIDGGFYDQSHFSHAVSSVFGQPPGRLHANLRRSRVQPWIDGIIPCVGWTP